MFLWGEGSYEQLWRGKIPLVTRTYKYPASSLKLDKIPARQQTIPHSLKVKLYGP